MPTLKTLIEEDKCQVIGMSRIEELDPNLLDLFEVIVLIDRPTNILERFGLSFFSVVCLNRFRNHWKSFDEKA